MIRLAWLSLLLCQACGLLLPSQPIGFREYLLVGVPFGEAVSIVRAVTEEEFLVRFGGGFSIDWEAEEGNLTVSPIYEPTRRLRMHIKITARGDDSVVEMFALVEHLDANLESGRLWGRPMQDVTFEEILYDAYIVEWLARKDAGG